MALAAAVAAPPAITETDILKTLDRRPLEMSVHSADASGRDGSDILLATSEGLIAVDPQFRRGKFLLREPVVSVARSPGDGRWIAAGPRGAWREDLGWFYPPVPPALTFDPDHSLIGPEPSIEFVTAGPTGLLLASKNDLWLMGPTADPLSAIHLIRDTGGLLGRPAATAEEAAVIGFWAVHRIPTAAGRAPAVDIPLPAEVRADIPLGVTYVGRSLLVICRRAGIYILAPGDRTFPPAISPPDIDRAHLEAGFPEGWQDFSTDGDDLYVMSSDARLHHMSVGQALQRISRWPDLAQPYRLSMLKNRRVLLYPARGNFLLQADPAKDDPPNKINFLATPSGEIFVRAGLPAGVFGGRSSNERWTTAVTIVLSVAVAAACAGWMIVFGVPGLHRFHPHASAYSDRLTRFQRDQLSMVQSFRRTEQELRRMEAPMDRTGPSNEELRKDQEDRKRVLSENREQHIRNLSRLAQSAAEEAHRIKSERAQSRPAADRPTLVARVLRAQTRAWEREFLRIADDVERVLNENP